jgi:hypothetical protein
MNNATRRTAMIAAGMLMLGALGLHASAVQPPALSVAEAAPFMGDWVVVAKGDYGENAFAVSVKTVADKVTLTISSDTMPEQIVTALARRDTSLVASYQITYEGNPVPVVLTLTPAAEGLDAAFDYAGGAYVAYGKGKKKTA